MQANGRRSRVAQGLPKLNRVYVFSLPKILISLGSTGTLAKESVVDTWPSGQIANALAVTATFPSSPPTSIESLHGPATPDCSQLPSPALKSILAEKGQEEAPLPNQEETIRANGSSQGLSEPVFTASSPSGKVIETLTVSQLESCRAGRAFQKKLKVGQLGTDSTALKSNSRSRVIYIISDVRVLFSFLKNEEKC